ncbi:hypothetical protein HYR99_06650 [Candidatus Poribacteria bacterium]|nr:hypothetical protein [Candidatus Poribacteria bacterium]
MKSRQFEVLSHKYLLPHLSGYGSKGPLLFVQPLKYLLRGFCFESSGFDPSAFYVWAFVQPLYVPSAVISLTFGKRLGGGAGHRWKITGDTENDVMNEVLASIKTEAIPIVEGMFESPVKLANKAVAFTHAPQDAYVVETVAYSFILAGEYSKALEALDHLQMILENVDGSLSWPCEMLHRASYLRSTLVRDAQEAIEVLDQWTEQTVKNLCLIKDNTQTRSESHVGKKEKKNKSVQFS